MTTIIRRRGLGYPSCQLLAKELDGTFRTMEKGQVVPYDDLYFRWGSTHSVANKEAKVINCSRAIHRASDKRGFRLACSEIDISPSTWTHPAAVPQEAVEEGLVTRRSRHAGGKDVLVSYTYEDVIHNWESIQGDGYISKRIDKPHEYRVHIVQGRVVGVSEKHPHDKSAVAWNFHGEDGNGVFTNFKWSEWPMGVVRVALAAHKLSRLHFGAVDVMADEAGNAYVLEINSAPSLSPYRASCYGRAFRHIRDVDNSWDTYVLTNPLECVDWRTAIHPAMRA